MPPSDLSWEIVHSQIANRHPLPDTLSSENRRTRKDDVEIPMKDTIASSRYIGGMLDCGPSKRMGIGNDDEEHGEKDEERRNAWQCSHAYSESNMPPGNRNRGTSQIVRSSIIAVNAKMETKLDDDGKQEPSKGD